MQLNNCGIRTSDDFNSFKYGPFDVTEPYNHPMSIRGIPLALYQSTMTIAIPFHWMAICQHTDSCNDVCSDVALQSHGTCLMRCSTTCLPGFFCSVRRTECSTSLTVCSISLTDDCIVTRVALLLYCWRVRSFRFFLTGEFDCCWVITEGGVDCGACGVDGTACWVDEIDDDGLDLTAITLSSLVLSLSIIAFISALISSLKLFIIACRAAIVTGISAVWVIGILLRLIGISLNDRMA